MMVALIAVCVLVLIRERMIEKERGLIVHVVGCVEMLHLEKERLMMGFAFWKEKLMCFGLSM